MKIIIVAPNVSLGGLASSFRISIIIRAFLEKGYEITLYTSKYPIKTELKAYSKLNVIYVKNRRNNNFLIKAFSKVFGLPDPMMFWGVKVASKIIYNRACYNDYDFSFYSSPPHSLQVIGLITKKILKLPFICDFRDDWMGSHRLSHFTVIHKSLSSKIESKVISEASAIFNAIPKVGEYLKLKYPNCRDKIFIATNGYDNAFKKKLTNGSFGLNYDYHTVVYCGGGYKGFISEKFNQLAHDLITLKLVDRWRIISAGPGIKVKESNKIIWKHYGLIEPNKVEELIANATVHLSILPKGDLMDSRTIPLKMYSQVLTKGTIIFIGNEGATNEVFKDLPGIFFFGNASWRNLGEFICKNELKLKEKYSRSVDRFNFNNIMTEYIDRIESLSFKNRNVKKK